MPKCNECGKVNVPNEGQSCNYCASKKKVLGPVFASFYVDNSDCMHPEIFYETAKKVAADIRESQKSIRTLLNLLKNAEWAFITNPKDADNKAREKYAEFVMHSMRQRKRDVIKSNLFIDIVQGHVKYVINLREYRGFVKYLTAIYAFLPKERPKEQREVNSKNHNYNK